MEQKPLEGAEGPLTDDVNKSEVEVYNPIAAGIALMIKKHGHVLQVPPDVSTPAGMESAKKSRKEMVTFRTSIEAARVKEKAASLAYGKLVDSEAKRITALAAPYELAYDAAITKEEKRLEAIRQEELEKERARIDGHRNRIQAIRDLREQGNMCRDSARIKQLMESMKEMLAESFEEFQQEAETVYGEVTQFLVELYDVKVAAETQAAELAKQQEKLRLEQQQETERRLREDAERERLDGLRAKLDHIRNYRVRASEAETAAEVAVVLEEAQALVIDDSYAEYTLEAGELLELAISKIQQMHAVKVQDEARAAEIQKQTEANQRQQQALDQQRRQQEEAQAAQAAKPLLSRVVDAVRAPAAAPAPASAPAVDPGPARRWVSDCEMDRPDDDAIIGELADVFDSTPAEVVSWLKDMDFDAVLAHAQEVAA